MNVFDVERLLEYARDSLPADVRQTEGMYEAFDAARHSLWRITKEEKTLNSVYYEGKNYSKNSVQSAMFISPIISAVIFTILFLIYKPAYSFGIGIACIVLQSAIMYIVYRYIDMKDHAHEYVDDGIPNEKDISELGL